jgi:hypothetical protein
MMRSRTAAPPGHHREILAALAAVDPDAAGGEWSAHLLWARDGAVAALWLVSVDGDDVRPFAPRPARPS